MELFCINSTFTSDSIFVVSLCHFVYVILQLGRWLVLLQLMLFIAAGRLQLLCLSVHFTGVTAAARV